MLNIRKFLLTSLTLITTTATAHGPMPTPLTGVPVPPVPGLLDGPDPIVIDKNKAIALGKALFWDINVGSDGMACASCHFSAGADSRTKHQINSGQKSVQPSGQTFDVLGSGSGGPNHTLTLSDFPFHQYDDPLHKTHGAGLLRTTDDVAASSGTFSGLYTGASKFSGSADRCQRSADPVYHVNGIGTRRVEPRNTPTVINAVFNHRNFWDGRANNIFNGSSIWGDRDPNAGVWVKINARTAVKQRLHLENSALASQAVGPGLSDLEMSCARRTWPDIGRKLLLRPPLQHQKVHHEDSVFAPAGLTVSTPGDLRAGLKTTYRTLITQAFNPKYWSYTRLGEFGGPVGQTPYNQMEANFALFFGLAIQLYESTLVSDQAPIDLSRRDENLIPIDLSQSALNGLDIFVLNHCNLCHAGPTLSTAAIQANAALVTPTPGQTYGPAHSPIAFGPDAMGPSGAARAAGIGPDVNVVTRDRTKTGGNRLMDFGFANTGVGDPDADPGVGGVDDFGHALSFTSQYREYLLDHPAGILDPQVGKVRSCDFIFPLALNTGTVAANLFTVPDGIMADGSKEGALRDQNCPSANYAFIPTAAAAEANLSGQKMAYSNQGVFKIPGLRNIELTGPYMHNGSMATLEQVVEFYGRGGNFDSPHKHNGTTIASLADFSPADIADLVEFMKSLTDERVRYERAPFDHPEIAIPHGHAGDESAATAGNPLDPLFAKDDYLVVPAVGAKGSTLPIVRFDQRLAP